jgi:hypothetical protein
MKNPFDFSELQPLRLATASGSEEPTAQKHASCVTARTREILGCSAGCRAIPDRPAAGNKFWPEADNR